MVSRNRKIARRIGQAVANDVLDISGAISAGAGVTVYATVDDLPTTGLTAGDEAFISGSNRLYISNGTGWYSIGLINTNPSITSVQDPSANTTPFTLATDGSALVLTITAADPEDVPLTYSYAVTTGSLTNGGGTTATVVQGTGANTNQFTITPTSTEAYAGTFELTFTASDGINQASSVNSFTLNFITTITNSKYTTLLATATGTSDNNNITDASTNNHTITVNGDAHAGTFSPYRSGGYSTYFDGTGDNLDISASSDFDFGTGDFTFEMSFYAEANTGTWQYLVTNRASGWGAGVFRFMVDAAATGIYCTFYGYDLGGYDIVPKTWYHISAVKSGDTITLYLNGATPTPAGGWYQSYSGVNNVSMGSSSKDVDVGSAGTSDYFKGYIRDLRIVKGTAITPPSGGPTEPLSSSGSALHICHLPYIADGSTNNHSITLNGNVATKSFSPYDYTEYSATDHGGAVYFDGTGDALRIADNSNIQLGTSPFTIEGWFYCTDTAPTQGILAKRDGSSEYWRWIIAAGNLNFRFQSTGLGSFTCNSVTIPSNTWCHFAVTRDNNNDVRQFVNGISTQSAINSTGNFDISGASLRVGEYELNTGHFNGYISDIKIVKNSALYTSNFTPPTAPLSSSGAALHIKGTDASIIDKSQSSNLKLVGNTTGSTTQVKFASSKSMYFDGTGDYITAGADAGNFGTGDFTIETWLRASSWNKGLFRKTTSTSSSSPPSISVYMASATIYIGVNSGTVDGTWMSATNPFTLNTWGHLAITRVSGLVNVYADGSRIISTTKADNVDNDITFRIGQWRNSTEYFTGYLQDFRITKGLARYTAADETSNIPSAPLEG